MTAIIWSVPILEVLFCLRGHTQSIDAVLFITDGIVLTGSGDDSIRVWRAETGAATKVIKKHSNRIRSLALSPNGALFASGSSDYNVGIFDATTYDCIHFVACSNMVFRVSFVSDGMLWAGVFTKELVSISVETGKIEKRYASHGRLIGIAVAGKG